MRTELLNDRMTKNKRFTVLLVALSFLGFQMLRADQPSEKTLASVSFDFTKYVPRTIIAVPVHVPLQTRKMGECILNDTANLPNPAVFHMTRSPTSDHFGYLVLGAVQITCNYHEGNNITPTLPMILEFAPYSVVDCIFTDGSHCTKDDLQRKTSVGQERSDVQTASKSSKNSDPLNLESNERQLIAKALQESNGDVPKAAHRLGISERALQRKMKEYRIRATYQ